MSIAPPSDIVLDVAQAADPTVRDAAVARLAKLGGMDASAADFTAALQGSSNASPGASALARPISVDIGTNGAPQHAARPMSPYQKFEAVLLQNFLQDTLPKDEDLFGDAASADTMRSMLAEQLANQMAASGRFGIAKMIEKHGKLPGGATMPHGTAPDLGPMGGVHAPLSFRASPVGRG